MNKSQEINLGKTMCYALRHNPQEFGLDMDDEGFVDLDAFVMAIRAHNKKWSEITKEDILEVVKRDFEEFKGKKGLNATEGRYQVTDSKIRAFHGHSMGKKIKRTPVKPPKYLYHGTATRFLEAIQSLGIKKMKRDDVHLTDDVEMALDSGRRHGEPIVLRVRAEEASNNNILFYREPNGIYLSEDIPWKYVEVLE